MLYICIQIYTNRIRSNIYYSHVRSHSIYVYLCKSETICHNKIRYGHCWCAALKSRPLLFILLYLSCSWFVPAPCLRMTDYLSMLIIILSSCLCLLFHQFAYYLLNLLVILSTSLLSPHLTCDFLTSQLAYYCLSLLIITVRCSQVSTLQLPSMKPICACLLSSCWLVGW